ncbi:MAG: UDP-N-acetylmuramoyl-tripeptide--D-alanyl-D-alanine ligase [Alphaproteobacteria bacterium]|nr:UDP-N-acetylmuramoyl-tripeptide--D-alanyl-D-alanine ligase [Alphaproteobacteria bacterium]
MTALWTSTEAMRATGSATAVSWTAGGVSIDTRTIAAGELFIALKGPNHDGHDHVAAAARSGAAAAMVHRRPADIPDRFPLLEVGDTLDGLARLGAAARARSGARIVAVTGSAGKTSTKEALRFVLARQGATAASAASHNNHWGVPLSLARMAPSCRYGVFEIGMNHRGEIAPLSRLVRPHVAIITTIAEAHIEFFGTLEAIAEEKADIAAGLEPGGVAVINRDVAEFGLMATIARRHGASRIIGFGTDAAAEARALAHRAEADGAAIAASIGKQRIDYRLPYPGTHWMMNSLAVLAAVQSLGGDVGAAARALGEMPDLDGRGRRHRIAVTGGVAVAIDESYNANPASMRAAFETLAHAVPGPGGRRVAILGDMLELGDKSAALHAALAEALVAFGIDRVHSAGPMMRRLHDALPVAMRGHHASSAAELAAAIHGELGAGDIIVIKGSYGSRMRVVLDALVSIKEPARVAGVKG